MTPTEWRQKKDVKREVIMTKEEVTRINDYISMINQRVGDMGTDFTLWEEIEDAYGNDQAEEADAPNSRVNIINPNIEGQVASIVEQNLSVATRGEGPSDEPFADWARIGLDWTIRKNKFKRLLDIHERRRLKFGQAWLNVCWDAEAVGKFGLAKIVPCPLNKVLIDGKIKDPLRVQDADYICELINVSKTYITEMYGDEKVRTVDFGYNQYADNGVFHEEHTLDDEHSITLMLYWTKHKGKLRLEEFTGDGVLLYDSHKTGSRDDNQKRNEADHVPYYKHVNNKYPYYYTFLYPTEGKLYGFGDGKLLLPLQELINDLYDKIRICARPDLLLIDTNSDIDIDGFDDTQYKPRLYNSAESAKPVESVKWGDVNQSWWALLSSIHQEAQRVTRFSDLMIGQGKSADTATEAAIQQQQGNAGTDHKKVLLQETLTEVCEYALGLMMENYTEAKAFRISEEKPEYEWIDFRKLTEVPMYKPATDSYTKEFHDKNPDKMLPDWELLTKQDGQPMTKNVELDIEISIGAGLPKNKAFIWQMIEKLAGLVSMNKQTGQPEPVMDISELRDFIKDFLGIPLKDDEELQAMLQQPMPGAVPQGQDQPMQNADAPLSMDGNPQTGSLSTVRGGGAGGYS